MRATRHINRAIELVRAAGERRGEGFFLGGLGAAFATLGHPEEARAAFDAAEGILREHGDPLLMAVVTAQREELAQGREHVPPSGVLTVTQDGRGFQPPGGPWIDFRRRRALRLVLMTLVEQRVRRPGAALPLKAVIDGGWPGEIMSMRAAANRVYVAIATLRDLGLRNILLSHDDGWLIAPTVGVKILEEPMADSLATEPSPAPLLAAQAPEAPAP